MTTRNFIPKKRIGSKAILGIINSVRNPVKAVSSNDVPMLAQMSVYTRRILCL